MDETGFIIVVDQSESLLLVDPLGQLNHLVVQKNHLTLHLVDLLGQFNHLVVHLFTQFHHPFQVLV